MLKQRVVFFVVNLSVLACSATTADNPKAVPGSYDRPQWRGPDRTGVSQEPDLISSWPQRGPRLLWTSESAGSGYSGPSIVGNQLFCQGADANQEFVFALDVQTGKQIWRTPYCKCYRTGWGDGPRSNPAVDGDKIYVIGGGGDIACLETATGAIRWQKSMQKDLQGQMMSGWGYCESPLVDGDQFVCSPGGPKGTLAALNKQTGEVLWRSEELKDLAAYSSIIVATVSGVRQYIQMTAKGIVGVDAKDGKLLWRHVNPAYRVAVIPTPIFHNDRVYASSGYNAGCELLKLTATEAGIQAASVYKNKNMVNHHGGVVFVGDCLYGFSDGNRSWVCQDFKTGRTIWAEKNKLGKGCLSCAHGQMYCYSEKTVPSFSWTPAKKAGARKVDLRFPEKQNCHARLDRFGSSW